MRAAWRTPLLAWAASRALVLAAGLVLSLALGIPERGVDPAVPRALALLGGWDTTWYLDLARNGYAYDLGQVGEVFTNLAFFPVLPGLMAAALAVGVNPFWAALVVANVAFLGALVAFRALSADRLDERTADLATWALALFPPAVAASQAYTEGIALLLAVAAGLAAWRGRWLLAGLAVAGAALTRPTGILVAVLVAMLAWQAGRPGRPRRLALAVGPGLAAFAAFLAWMQVARGSWGLPFQAQRAWDRGEVILGLVTVLPGEIAAAVGRVVSLDVGVSWVAVVRDLLAGALYVVLLVALARREGWRSPWVVYSLLVVALPVASGTVTSLARIGLVAFPLAWPAAHWLGADRGRARRAAGAAVVLGVAFVALLAWRSP
jgi:hypothetical protein